jgi:hypothetical protein
MLKVVKRCTYVKYPTDNLNSQSLAETCLLWKSPILFYVWYVYGLYLNMLNHSSIFGNTKFHACNIRATL